MTHVYIEFVSNCHQSNTLTQLGKFVESTHAQQALNFQVQFAEPRGYNADFSTFPGQCDRNETLGASSCLYLELESLACSRNIKEFDRRRVSGEETRKRPNVWAGIT